MTETVLSLCHAAARDVNIIMSGENLSANDGDVVLRALNLLFDSWNVKAHAAYTVTLITYPITPALQPHTIGPTGTYVVAQRPVSIDAANIVLPGSPASHDPIAVVTDPTAWASLSLPGTTSSMPTALYYQPDSPNGKIYLYPVPDTAHSLELLTRQTFASLVMTDTLELPPGYLNAVQLTLEERLVRLFPRAQMPLNLDKDAREARADIFAVNDRTPPLTTVDAGMPGSQMRGHYDWRTGGWA